MFEARYETELANEYGNLANRVLSMIGRYRDGTVPVDTAGNPVPASVPIDRAVGSVDVFVGHSMGGGAGGVAVREHGFRPRLFIALGADPHLGENSGRPELLFLAGRFEEFIPPSRLKARTDARLVLSPWCDHVLEPWDPYLVNAGVEAACAAIGKTPPTPGKAWIWRAGR